MCGMDKGDQGGAYYADANKQTAWETLLNQPTIRSRMRSLYGREYADYCAWLRERFEDEYARNQDAVTRG